MVEPEGLVIGLLPRCEPSAADVDFDVSRRHARLRQEDGHLYILDLNSTSGTYIERAGELIVVAPPKHLAGEVFVPQAVELQLGDILRLGATTRYVVLPALEPGAVLKG